MLTRRVRPRSAASVQAASAASAATYAVSMSPAASDAFARSQPGVGRPPRSARRRSSPARRDRRSCGRAASAAAIASTIACSDSASAAAASRPPSLPSNACRSAVRQRQAGRGGRGLERVALREHRLRLRQELQGDVEPPRPHRLADRRRELPRQRGLERDARRRRGRVPARRARRRPRAARPSRATGRRTAGRSCSSSRSRRARQSGGPAAPSIDAGVGQRIHARVRRVGRDAHRGERPRAAQASDAGPFGDRPGELERRRIGVRLGLRRRGPSPQAFSGIATAAGGSTGSSGVRRQPELRPRRHPRSTRRRPRRPSGRRRGRR